MCEVDEKDARRVSPRIWGSLVRLFFGSVVLESEIDWEIEVAVYGFAIHCARRPFGKSRDDSEGFLIKRFINTFYNFCIAYRAILVDYEFYDHAPLNVGFHGFFRISDIHAQISH